MGIIVEMKYGMRKILLLSTLVIALLGSIVYIDYKTQLDADYKKEGMVIQPPFNQLNINRDALTALGSSLPGSHLISAHYYIDNSNMDDYHFFTLNTFDLSYLFSEKGVKDNIYYESYLNSSLNNVSNGNSPHRRVVNGAPAVSYYYQKDMGDSLFIPTKAAIICCNRKAYYLEVSAIGNVDKWFDKVEQSISFYDFAKMRKYSIAFMVLSSIAMAIALFFIVRNIAIFIKRDRKRKSKVVWINKKVYILYRYIKTNVILSVVSGLILLCIDGDIERFFGMLIIVETLIKNGLILIYLRKKATQEYSEDYLVPQWFKDKLYKYMNNKSELRGILLFLYMPLFYIIPLPFGTYAIVFYIIPVCLLTGAYLGFKWIKAGKNESL